MGLWGETVATGNPMSTLSRVGVWRGMKEAINAISGWSPLHTTQPSSLPSGYTLRQLHKANTKRIDRVTDFKNIP